MWGMALRGSSVPADQLYRGQTRYLDPTRGWGYFSVSIILRAGQSLTAGLGCVSSVFTRTTASPSPNSPASIFSQSLRLSMGLFGRHGQACLAFIRAANDLRSHLQT